MVGGRAPASIPRSSQKARPGAPRIASKTRSCRDESAGETGPARATRSRRRGDHQGRHATVPVVPGHKRALFVDFGTLCVVEKCPRPWINFRPRPFGRFLAPPPFPMLRIEEDHMDGLLALSDQLATAVQQAVGRGGGQWTAARAVDRHPLARRPDRHRQPHGTDGRRPHRHVPERPVGTRDGRRPRFHGRYRGARVGVSDVALADVGDSDAVRVGHMMLAVGAGPRASWGVIGAIGAAWSSRSGTDVFSLDLTLYPGFSGGPLVDVRGRHRRPEHVGRVATPPGRDSGEGRCRRGRRRSPRSHSARLPGGEHTAGPRAAWLP